MKSRNALFVLAVLALSTGTSEARRTRKIGGQKYVANGKFGLGLELGAPFGLNGKYFLSDDRALNFGIGEVYDRYYYNDDRDGIHLYLDYLFHPFVLTTQEAFQLPFYIGVGGRLWHINDRFNDHADALGVRVPIGIAFDFNKVPLDFFIQLTFVADLFFGYNDRANQYDRAGLHVEGSIGIRYWFD